MLSCAPDTRRARTGRVATRTVWDTNPAASSLRNNDTRNACYQRLMRPRGRFVLVAATLMSQWLSPLAHDALEGAPRGSCQRGRSRGDRELRSESSSCLVARGGSRARVRTTDSAKPPLWDGHQPRPETANGRRFGSLSRTRSTTFRLHKSSCPGDGLRIRSSHRFPWWEPRRRRPPWNLATTAPGQRIVEAPDRSRCRVAAGPAPVDADLVVATRARGDPWPRT